MSRELVSSAFRLSGTVAPWVFSVSLASLAILLKPAYTRLIESQYWNGSPRPFAITITLTCIMAIACLAVLGTYRYEAHANRTELRHLQQKLQQRDEVNLEAVRGQIATLQREIAESPYGWVSFVLTTVLFALAGAIALGIGIRHLRGFYYLRLWGWWQRRTHRAHLKRCRREYADLLDRMAEKRKELSLAEAKLQTLPPVPTLQDRISSLQDQKTDIHETKKLIEKAFLSGVFQLSLNRDGTNTVAQNGPTAPSTEDPSPKSVTEKSTTPKRSTSDSSPESG